MSKISYSVSGPDSNFAINSTSIFDPIFSESKSESDVSESDYSVYESRHLCFFLPYICILLNKLMDGFFYLFS